MWLDHPIVGAGWQVSLEPSGFDPYLAAAHRRFPNEPAEPFRPVNIAGASRTASSKRSPTSGSLGSCCWSVRSWPVLESRGVRHRELATMRMQVQLPSVG